MAIGRKETSAASKMTDNVTSGLRRSSGTTGKIKIAHGSSNGRLLALAPVSSAAARIECHKSVVHRPAWRDHVRAAKSIAASAKTAGKVSLQMLPACSRKL